MEERKVLVDMVFNRYCMNTGMHWKELCENISMMVFSTYKNSDNRYKYLVNSGKLSELKKGG